MSSIAILGYGYWGSVIHKILVEKGKYGVVIFSSRDRPSFIDASSYVLPSSYLLDSLSPSDFLGALGVTHLIICAGPGVDPRFLSRLVSCKTPLSVWIEKPFYLSLPLSSPFFVDYIYVSRNIGAAMPAEQWDSVFSSPDVCLSVYSKRKYERHHSIHDDFLPHLSSYLSLCGQSDSKGFVVRNFLRLDSSCFCCELVLPASRRLVFKYGISSEFSSLQWSSGPSSLEIKNLCDLFPEPVNANIDFFLSDSWRDSQSFFAAQNLITESFVCLSKACDL